MGGGTLAEGRWSEEETRGGSTGMTTGLVDGVSGLSAPERTICFMKRTRERGREGGKHLDSRTTESMSNWEKTGRKTCWRMMYATSRMVKGKATSALIG